MVFAAGKLLFAGVVNGKNNMEESTIRKTFRFNKQY